MSWLIKVSLNHSINNILIFGRCEEWRCDDWSLLMFPISWKWQKEAKSLGVRLKQNLINVARSTDRHTALNLYIDKNIVIMINKWAGGRERRSFNWNENSWTRIDCIWQLTSSLSWYSWKCKTLSKPQYSYSFE